MKQFLKSVATIVGTVYLMGIPLITNATGIAYDATAGTQNIHNAFDSNSITGNATASVAGETALVWVADNCGSALTVTVGGVNMTSTGVTNTLSGARVTLYYSDNAPTVSTAYAVSCSASNPVLQEYVSFYSGVVSGNPLDTSNFASGSPSVTNTTTTSVDGDWLLGMCRNSSFGNCTAGTGTTVRGTNLFLTTNADSNGPITPAGSGSMGWTAGAGTTDTFLESIKPAIVAALPNATYFNVFWW